MSTPAVIAVDLADIWEKRARKDYLRTLAWGDEVKVIASQPGYLKVEINLFEEQLDGSVLPVKKTGYIEPTKSSKIAAKDCVRTDGVNTVLKVNFVDVQQGDGAVIESPDGKVILVDGGDNQLFARYLAGRFRGSDPANRKKIDCIIVTHGDADHFSGLVEIQKSESHTKAHKRLFIQPERVYHNGLVKRPSKRNGKTVPDKELFGKTVKSGNRLLITGLESDLLTVPDSEMNEPFRDWKHVLEFYNAITPVTVQRVQRGDDSAFSFFNNGGLRIELLAPTTEKVSGAEALPFLGKPRRALRRGDDSTSLDADAFSGLSASHTINGNSIVFRLTYGAFSYLFSGDLNDEAGRLLAREHNLGLVTLRSDVFKVPHHGSADFSGGLLAAVAPVVSIVSSGDETVRKEYIHPRATLIGALGRHSRIAEPLIFVTELVAFFQQEGYAELTDKKKSAKRGPFYAFSRAVFGIVKTRTDGQRLLVYTDSANVQMKEAYSFEIDDTGIPAPVELRRA